MNNTHYTAIGIDVSDRKSQVCVMTKTEGSPKIVLETMIPTSKEGLTRFLATQDKAIPVTFETGTHCRWMNEVATSMGFKVYVANPCRLRLVTASKTKNDINDARMLARLTLADVGLLHPVKLRSAEYQKMIHFHELRNSLVKQRTRIIVQLRSIAKSMGFRIPQCSAASFHRQDMSLWPKEFKDIIWSVMKDLEQLAISIKFYEKQIRELAETPTFKAQVDRLREIRYVGLLVATGFVAVIGGDVARFEKARDVGPWLGLTPKQDQSGDIDKQCHVTKAGSPLMRQLLTESAQMILRESSVDTDLKLKGLRICQYGAKIAKRKAVTAVARSLAVMMVAMLKKPDMPYIELSEHAAKELSKMRMPV